MKGACLSHCQRVSRPLSALVVDAPESDGPQPRKGVQRNLPRLRSLFNLDQSEIRVNPRLRGGTRHFQYRSSLDHQTAPHLRLLAIGIEYDESELRVSRS